MNLLENDLAECISLDGEWQFRFAGGAPQAIPVPSAWEAHMADKLADGPALYRRAFQLPESWTDGLIVLDCQAASYAATVFVNGRRAGHHRGMWAPFQIDVTPFVHPGENTVEVEVWKPGGRFPMRESLAGFLPDVAVAFGGLWQGVQIRRFRAAAAHDARISPTPEGGVCARGRLAWLGPQHPAHGWLELLDAFGNLVDRSPLTLTAQPDSATMTYAGQVGGAALERWSPSSPALYRAVVTLADDATGEAALRLSRRIGIRHMRASGDVVLLNGAPVHLRGVLDWGWDAARICPAPSREEVLDQIAKARSLGFNMIKLCLFVPDETTFDAADEQGMLIWLELPMWLPQVTPEFRELALREYQAVLRRVHHHPSIAVVSLGCELDAQADAPFLGELSRLAREWLPDCLQCDNSGSAEAYGGVTTSLGEFYDYHFYTDPHFFPALVDHFDRAYQPRKPWLYGEFCDADTLRDFSQLPADTWWLAGDLWLQRDEVTALREHRQRLSTAGVTDGGAALTRIGRRQATAVRKFIFEQVRSRHASGGYVITGWTDTPIATSGVVDDRRELKFPPEEWRPFNADRVLVMDRERRRKWTYGGDRPAHADPFTGWQGETIEVHLSLSNGAGDVHTATLRWQLSADDGTPLAEGSAGAAPVPGGVAQELAVLRLAVPESDPSRVAQLELRAWLDAPDASAQNAWHLWAVPRIDVAALETAAARLDRGLSDDVLRRVRAGETALVWLRQPDPRFTTHAPFWREAIHVFEPHPIWDAIPHAGHADLRFFGLATDVAIDPEKLRALAGRGAEIKPVWRRFDARVMTWSEYLVEVRCGAGRLLLSTLRFEGGSGRQPSSFGTNPLGAWMLSVLMGIAGRQGAMLP